MINADDGDAIQMIAAFDHEELGSASRSGASGPLLADILTRISDGLGATLDQRHRSLAKTFCLSADTGHAIHPNYPNRHDPANQPLLNSGPLLKINANQRYATDGRGAALWRRVCRRAGIRTQEFVIEQCDAVRLDHWSADSHQAGNCHDRRRHPHALHALGSRAGRHG